MSKRAERAHPTLIETTGNEGLGDSLVAVQQELCGLHQYRRTIDQRSREVFEVLGVSELRDQQRDLVVLSLGFVAPCCSVHGACHRGATVVAATESIIMSVNTLTIADLWIRQSPNALRCVAWRIASAVPILIPAAVHREQSSRVMLTISAMARIPRPSSPTSRSSPKNLRALPNTASSRAHAQLRGHAQITDTNQPAACTPGPRPEASRELGEPCT